MKDRMRCWPLWGVGLENLGCGQAPCEFSVPQPGPDELLMRIEAIGLCFSDIKLIRAGEDHPRVISENLRKDPVIPGHEAVMTVVTVGDSLADRFKVGERFIIQADIYVNGKGFAYGYAINGGMAEYSVLDQRVLNGDEGCYLLPIQPDTPAGIAALIEPWTCVIASYMIEHRSAPADGGRMLVVCDSDVPIACRYGEFGAAGAPADIDGLHVSPENRDALAGTFPDARINTLDELPASGAYDDIVICGVRNREQVERIVPLAAVNGLVSFVGETYDGEFSADVGSIHYKGWFLQGTPSRDIADAYGRNVRSKLRKGGTCWLVGGAGAMGQMHTQLAVEDTDGPDRILVSDLDSHRIQTMNALLAPAVEKRGIEYCSLNPKDFSSEKAFYEAVRQFAPAGFDDIVMLVPVVPVVNAAMAHLAVDGLMNIFAGIPAGKEAVLDVGAIRNRGVRFVGSSGSRMEHMRKTLDLVESKHINPATALAAIGGMNALWEGLDGVANARFAGKTVIFPHCPELPLTAMEAVRDAMPEVAKTLSEDGFYTQDTEAELSRRYGDGEGEAPATGTP